LGHYSWKNDGPWEDQVPFFHCFVVVVVVAVVALALFAAACVVFVVPLIAHWYITTPIDSGQGQSEPVSVAPVSVAEWRDDEDVFSFDVLSAARK